ncbi:phosphotransferase family enzyme [Microbacteriaceae bacterium MWH-Ta3]|nr:phosphotransferase family enzyme [Microbacteriaceae bacterium MWH-Ta3]
MLTAYAAIAVPHVALTGYREITRDGCVAILGRTADGALVSVSSPVTAEAAAIQDREHAMGMALSRGVQSQLPFTVPATVGATTVDGHRVVVSTEVQGIPAAAVKNKRDLWPSLGEALAAIHALPVSIAARGSLNNVTALDSLRDAAGVIDRATQTSRVPSVLLDRWDAAVEDSEMWQFTPTVVHGNFDLDAVVTDGHTVTGITHWASAHIGDPAHDLRFAIGRLPAEFSAQILNSYSASRPARDLRLEHRARFLSELDIAKWLLHGIELKDDAIVTDAVGLLDGLVAAVAGNPAAALSFAPLAPTILAPESTTGETPAVTVFVESDSDAPTDFASGTTAASTHQPLAAALPDSAAAASPAAASVVIGAGVAATASALVSKLGSLSWKRSAGSDDAFVEPEATAVQPPMHQAAAPTPSYDTEPLFVEPDATTEAPVAHFVDDAPEPARADDDVF